ARIPDFLAAGDVFAFPSLSEAFGFSVLEAAPAGLPIVASNIPALREVLAPRGPGSAAAVFFDPTGAADLAGALRVVLDPGGVRLRDLEEGRRRVVEAFTLTAMVDG